MTGACVDYQPERYVALDLVGRGLICVVDGMTQRTDDSELAPGVFAALITLRAAGCFELQRPGPDSNDCQRLARLTPLGVRLVKGFAVEHDRRAIAAVTGQPNAVGTNASTPVRGLGR